MEKEVVMTDEAEAKVKNPLANVICVDYPGRVVNVSNMIDTLGGRESLARTFSDPARRLELRFRPQDPLSKPVCGDRQQVSSLLLRVRLVKDRRPCTCGCRCSRHRNQKVGPSTK